MRKEVDRLASLMQELLDYGKPLETALAPELLGPVVAEAADSCASLASRSRVKVAMTGLDGLPPVSITPATPPAPATISSPSGVVGTRAPGMIVQPPTPAPASPEAPAPRQF